MGTGARLERVYEGVRVLSVFFAYYGASGRDRWKFIDNTERKDQRGKERQKESLYNLRVRSFFELKRNVDCNFKARANQK